ncbi:hypothetical protein AVEN_193252-1 [Araneus ventricosus]|uniref:Uncharacterized protein n=1 Tax=Araneus ventricosus TaxID=182803 RepID=A0A4Y2HN14_ARAVE|nr:hypothetical protein AVEN_193252-1 [Araneus ventricosus]
MDGQTQTLGLNRKILQYPNKTSGKSREPTGDSTKHIEDDFTSRLQNVWFSTGQKRGFTHFQLDNKGSATPSKESSYLISKDLFHHSHGRPSSNRRTNSPPLECRTRSCLRQSYKIRKSQPPQRPEHRL